MNFDRFSTRPRAHEREETGRDVEREREGAGERERGKKKERRRGVFHFPSLPPSVCLCVCLCFLGGAGCRFSSQRRRVLFLCLFCLLRKYIYVYSLCYVLNISCLCLGFVHRPAGFSWFPRAKTVN